MRERICKISLFSLILACVSTMSVDAAVKTKNSNRSYAGAYQQLNAMYGQQQGYSNDVTVSAAASLPVMVTDEKLANSIINNEVGAPSVSELEACSMIYLNGNFKWGSPEYGVNHDPQCIAVVELRDVNSNAVLASTTVAAGQSIKCNIDSFPSGSYNMSALSRIELPADNAPTMEDVIAVMNEEQKQNAGLKITAGAIIAGVAGNLLAPKDVNAKEGKIPLGTGKTQLADTAIGAITGAGIMAASSYSGKVAGDTIKSTAVNAASGMLIGNMLAGANGGDSVMATTKCTIGDGGKEYDCVIGKYAKDTGEFAKDKKIGNTTYEFFIIKLNQTGLKGCNKKGDYYKCDDLPNQNIAKIQVEKREASGSISLDELRKKNPVDNSALVLWHKIEDGTNKGLFEEDHTPQGNGDVYYKINSAHETANPVQAFAIFESGQLNKAFGYKVTDWSDLSKKKPKLYLRHGSTVGEEIKDKEGEPLSLDDFKPSSRDADDGGLIDMSNQARAKGTIVGTAAGGALGGLAGYEGAKTEVSERWTSAVREYENSLTNFVCVTGSRPLSKYNDYADIPALNKD